jgi:hypothetical protein
MDRLDDLLMGGSGHCGYAFNADVWCVECGRDLVRLKWRNGDRPNNATFQDSNEWPQPIFFGESDVAQHCAGCGEHCYGPEEEESDDWRFEEE